jgi:non-ribosomal peptide synthetase component E (peptide arylation enzyme)
MPTGGTTGLPKLVPRTHDDYLCNSRFRALATGRAADDVALIATPITHNMAIEVSLVPGLWTGGTVVLLGSTAAGDILDAIGRERATFTILVPAQLHDLAGHPDLGRADCSSLRAVAGAGDRVPPELADVVVERLGRPFIHVFGMSEGPCANTRPDDPHEVVRSTVGVPICPGDEFRVVDEAGRPLPAGEAGELVARGPGIFRGYFKAEAINRDAFLPGGFFRTGDLARIDAAGRITLTGRRKDVIVRGGEKIPGALVEQYLATAPGIARAAVVGIPDARLGERICAFVEPGPGGQPSVEGIAEHFRREGISPMLCPERVEVLGAFPLTAVGKLDRGRLREIAAGLPPASQRD